MDEIEKALVERLRSVDISWSQIGEWCAEAADVIEALTYELERLQAALAWMERHQPSVVEDIRIRAARAALAQETQP